MEIIDFDLISLPIRSAFGDGDLYYDQHGRHPCTSLYIFLFRERERERDLAFQVRLQFGMEIIIITFLLSSGFDTDL